MTGMTILIVLVALLFLVMIGSGIFWFLIQAGVIVQKAMEPPTTDTNNYQLSQGHEVRSEEQANDTSRVER